MKAATWAAAPGCPLERGRSRLRRVGTEGFDFIGGFEAGFGRYDACSLLSPMFEFANPAAARATALAVLATLRQPAVTAPAAAPARSTKVHQ